VARVGAAIRLFRYDDAKALADLTLSAIRITGLVAYSPDQIAAWAARHPGPQGFIDRAAGGATILVAVDGDDRPLAYVLTEPDGHCDMLYCHPDHTGRGLAGSLLTAAEVRARSAGIDRLFTEASELARPVFERADFTTMHRRDFNIANCGHQVAIHNYAMEKLIC
jgi:putative acetyltransferase